MESITVTQCPMTPIEIYTVEREISSISIPDFNDECQTTPIQAGMLSSLLERKIWALQNLKDKIDTSCGDKRVIWNK